MISFLKQFLLSLFFSNCLNNPLHIHFSSLSLLRISFVASVFKTLVSDLISKHNHHEFFFRLIKPSRKTHLFTDSATQISVCSFENMLNSHGRTGSSL